MASRVASSARASSSRVARGEDGARRARASAVSRRRAGAVGDARVCVETALRDDDETSGVADGPGCFALEDAAGAVVFVGGGRRARDALRAYAATTTRDVRNEVFVGAVETLPKRSRSSAVRNAMKAMLEGLEYAPEDNAAATTAATAETVGYAFSSDHLRALERDGYVVVDDLISQDVARAAAASARAMYDRGVMQNLRQEGRDDDVAVLATSSLPAGDEFAGLRPCVEALLRVPDDLRRVVARVDDDALGADVVSKVRACRAPDRLMLARYGAESCRYVPHLDNDPSDDANDAGSPGLRPSDRVFTLIAYLNPDWDATRGGRFRAYRPGVAADAASPSDFVDIDPILGRVVVFDAAKLLHEVRPSFHDRYAVTVWTRGAELLPA